MNPIIGILPAGLLKVILVNVINTNPQPLRPPAGKAWLILDAWGSHNDTGAVNANWEYTDGSTTIAKQVASVGSGNDWPLNMAFNATANFGPSSYPVMSPLTLTNSLFAQLRLASLTAGKAITVKALVLEYTP